MLAEAPRYTRCYVPKEILDHIRTAAYLEDFLREKCALTSHQSKSLRSCNVKKKGHEWNSSESLMYVSGYEEHGGLAPFWNIMWKNSLQALLVQSEGGSLLPWVCPRKKGRKGVCVCIFMDWCVPNGRQGWLGRALGAGRPRKRWSRARLAPRGWGSRRLLKWRAHLPESRKWQVRQHQLWVQSPKNLQKSLWNVVCFKYFSDPESWRPSYNFITQGTTLLPLPASPTLPHPSPRRILLLPGARRERPSPSTAAHLQVASHWDKGKT